MAPELGESDGASQYPSNFSWDIPTFSRETLLSHLISEKGEKSEANGGVPCMLGSYTRPLQYPDILACPQNMFLELHKENYSKRKQLAMMAGTISYQLYKVDEK